jgi:hypothetical protein
MNANPFHGPYRRGFIARLIYRFQRRAELRRERAKWAKQLPF